ncbi:MAG: hypothetical protein ACMXYF_02930 [Candidatus Woesearchaeota archaeon]
MRQAILTISVFVVFFATILYFFSPTLPYVTDQSYDVLRNIESIEKTQQPLFFDSQSQLGKERVLNPFSYYVLFFVQNISFFYKFLIGALFFVGFFYAKLHLNRIFLQNIVAILFATTPLFTLYAIRTISLEILAIFFGFVSYVLFLYWLRNKAVFIPLLLVTVVGCFIHPIFGLFLFAKAAYYVSTILLKRSEKRVKEYVFFTTLFFIVSQYFLYYKAIMHHGFTVFWLDTNKSYLLDVLIVFPQFGLLAVVLAMIGVYWSLKKDFSHTTYLHLSLIVCALVASLTYIISGDFFLIITVLAGVALLPQFFSHLQTHLFTTKFSSKRFFIAKTIGFFLVLFMIIPAFSYPFLLSDHRNDLKEPLLWIEQNTSEESVVLVFKEYAFQTMYYAKRATVIDRDPILSVGYAQKDILLTQFFQSYFAGQVRSIFTQLGIIERPIYVLYLPQMGVQSEVPILNGSCFEKRIEGVYEYVC